MTKNQTTIAPREPARLPRIWLAVMGISNKLGSEPLVGWQWYCRLKARGDVTVLTAAIFDHDDFLPPDRGKDMVFIDTLATDRKEFVDNHGLHLWRWWRGVRTYLKTHAAPQDILLVTTPAAIWMLPWISGLPISRDRAYFGPLGIDWVPKAIRGTWFPGKRNTRTFISLVLWRMLSRLLPRNITIRAPYLGFGNIVGAGFNFLGSLPEIEPSPMVIKPNDQTPTMVALLYDPRPRKRFATSFDYALEQAKKFGLPITIVDVPAPEEQLLTSRAAAAGVAISFEARMTRPEFQAWLVSNSPEFVSLSSSEGISSTNIEVLMAGCHLHVHDIGGNHWLIEFGSSRVVSMWRGATVIRFCWDSNSLASFSGTARVRFDTLLSELLPKIERGQ